jgi:hypothetical protein
VQFLPRLYKQGLLILQTAGHHFHARFGFRPALLRFSQHLPQLAHLCLVIIQALLKGSSQGVSPLRALTAFEQLCMYA